MCVRQYGMIDATAHSANNYDCEVNEADCAPWGGAMDRRYGCERVFDNDATADFGEWSTASECGGWVQLEFGSPVAIDSMGFQQRWAEIDWVTTVTLSFDTAGGCPDQVIQLQQVPSFATYPITTCTTAFVKVTLTGIAHPQGSSYTMPDGTVRDATCNTGAKEIEFYEAGATPHGCYIGIQDTFREARRTWSDGSPVDYANWAAGEPSPGSGIGANSAENYGEMDFRTISRCQHGAGGYQATVNNGCESLESRNGKWNDSPGATPLYFVCESNTYTPEIEFTYLGCYQDGIACQSRGTQCRDMNGVESAAAQDADSMNSDPFFSMGDEGGPAKCAQLCQGFKYMGLQYGSECYCDNANTMTQPDVETTCDSPCSGDDSIMCGGSWHNSVYELGSTYWENAGYDDSGWEAAADLGHNGVAPWYKRPQISEAAKWIWSPDAATTDHVYCRYVQPNGPVNCFAAQSRYWDDYPAVANTAFPAFQHFTTIGKARGNIWHSELCNTCTQADYTIQCAVAQQAAHDDQTNDATHGAGAVQGSGPTSVEGQMQCDSNLCTNKCRGLHDAYDAVMVGAVPQTNAAAYGETGTALSFPVFSCVLAAVCFFSAVPETARRSQPDLNRQGNRELYQQPRGHHDLRALQLQYAGAALHGSHCLARVRALVCRAALLIVLGGFRRRDPPPWLPLLTRRPHRLERPPDLHG